jgi:NitT/TauT family transport system ATP-binding protein
LLADEVLVMTGRPGAISGRIGIDLPRPRQPDVQTTADFHHYAAAVRAAIEESQVPAAVRAGPSVVLF